MNTFFALYRRKPLFPVLLFLLLLLAVSLTVIGTAMLVRAHKQASDISDNYVTIAVFPDYRMPTVEEREDGAYVERAYNPFVAHELALKSGFVQSADYRYLLGAEVKGSKAITSGFQDLMNYDKIFDQPCYNMAVLAVKCKSVRANDDAIWTDLMGNPIAHYHVGAEILDVLSLADSYPNLYDDTALISGDFFSDVYLEDPYAYEKASVPVPATIDIVECLFTPEGEIPFQEGKTYLVYGFYSDYEVIEIQSPKELIRGRYLRGGRALSFLDDTRPYTYNNESSLYISDISEMNDYYDKALQVKRGSMSDGMPYLYPNQDMLPRWAEYSGSWEEYLATDEGQIWREEILPMCEVNQSSATVILSDNVQSMYAFNSGTAGLLDGRFFLAEEYTNGNKVCMISAAYAQYNGYQIGDKLSLDFYDVGFFNSDTIPRGPCLPENRMNITGEYEIVGIYSAPEFSEGTQLFCADTILIPKRSVPGSDQFREIANCSLLCSLILENGTHERFQAYMEQAGQGDAYVYFDQNFSAAEISLDAMIQIGQKLLLIGIAALVFTAALSHFLSVRRFSPTAKTMRLLGIDRNLVRRQAFSALLLPDGAGAVFGAGFAAVLFTRITEKTLFHALSPDPVVIVCCAVVVFLLLMLPSLLCARTLSHLPLMQTGKKRKPI